MQKKATQQMRVVFLFAKNFILFYNKSNKNFVKNMENNQKPITINVSTFTIVKVILILLALYFLFLIREILFVLFFLTHQSKTFWTPCECTTLS